MAEGLIAIGVAANIMQFVDLGSRILYTSYKICVSAQGFTKEHRILDSLTNDLQNVSHDLQCSIREGQNQQGVSQNDVQLQRLIEQCSLTCHELLLILDQIKAPINPSKWDSLRAARKSIWKESKMKKIQACLDEYRQAITMRVLSGLRYVL